MRILHYSLGFPPYRTGGLIKYCIDLMLTQQEQGHEVALLWPGEIGLADHKLKIRNGRKRCSIESFEIKNPLPVSLDEGVRDIKAYTRPVDMAVYIRFLRQYAPDVIHIHTLMGLHKEFIEGARTLSIKTIFTSHDYYGLCQKVTLFYDGHPCDDDHDCRECIRCNQTALSIEKIFLMQSPVYRLLKETDIVRKIRLKHRQRFFSQEPAKMSLSSEDVISRAQEYCDLRAYYVRMLESMDVIHFNSSVTEQIYRRFLTPRYSRIVPITHRDIGDHRKRRDYNHPVLRLTYLGPAKPFKGFYLLLHALDKLWFQENRAFKLNIYAPTLEQRPYMTNSQEGYQHSQLGEIFEKTDLLVVPSLWYETFGFTVLEAVSYGVPVLVSSHTGAKDILDNGRFGFIEEPEEMSIKKLLGSLMDNRDCLARVNQAIIDGMEIQTMKVHSDDILQLYMPNSNEIS